MTAVVACPRGQMSIDEHGFARSLISHTAAGYAAIEHFLIAAPAIAQPEQHKKLENPGRKAASPA